MLDLGWLTVGTAEVPDTVMHTWVVELLTSPPWGVVRYAENAAAQAISDIAELHRRLTPGETPPTAVWDSAARSAQAISAMLSVGADGMPCGPRYQSTSLVYTDDWDTLDAVTGNALRAHRLANEGAGAARIVDVTRHAIRCGADWPG